jgi:hypothetical protein
MRYRILAIAVAVGLLAALGAGVALADKPIKVDSQGTEIAWQDNGCPKIQSGEIFYSAGHYLSDQPISVGYDPFGYNYQAHMFKGSYFNVYSGRDGLPPYEGDAEAYLAANPGAASHWAWPYRDVNLLMKWNDAWISNTDCGVDGDPESDPDGKLDRHWGFPTYIGSGAWETNHMWGEYEIDGKTCNWDYFVKIVAAPADGYSEGGYWYAADGTEIGPAIWGAFAIIQQVENDPCAGIHGLQYVSPDHAGFGGW